MVAFVLHAQGTIVGILAAAIVVCGASIREPLRAIAPLPATALLGPIATIALPGGLIVHLGDLYLGALALVFVMRHGWKSPLQLGRHGPLLSVLLCLVMISWLFSLDMFTAIPTIVGILEFVLVYLLTRSAVRDVDDAGSIVNAWIVAVTLCSLVVVVSYLRGDLLILNATKEARAHAEAMRTSETLLFRASFFVTSFIFPLASVVSVSVAKLIFDDPPTPSRRFLLIVIVANCGAIIAMGNATAAVGAACAIGSLVLFLAWMPEARRRFVVGTTGILFAAVLLVIVVRQILPPAQIRLLIGRGSDTASLDARLFVWRNVFEYLLDSPRALYLGLGPDISIRLTDSSLLRSLFLGGGLQQAAVDNGYLYLSLNYGIFALIAVLLVGASTMYLFFVAAIRGNKVAVSLWTVMIAWAIMSITQQHGVAKPVFMIVQIVALTDVIVSWPRRIPATI